MSLSRRDFVKLCTGTVAGFGISQMFHPAVYQAIAGTSDGKKPIVFWLQGQGCTGCSVTLLNSVHPKILDALMEKVSLDAYPKNVGDLLLNTISLNYHPTVMGAEGESTFEHMMNIVEKSKQPADPANPDANKYFVVVEGSIPTAADGKYCIIGDYKHKEVSMADAMLDIGANAAAVLAVGTCASYGGIPAAKGSETGAMSVSGFFKENKISTPVINIPGCPPHPDWIVGTLVFALDAIKRAGSFEKAAPEILSVLDSEGRPSLYYGENVHENCPYLDAFENNQMAVTFMDKSKCRYDIGCKGPNSSCDSFKRKWNNGVNWCVENAVCIGCVEPTFPDGKSPFYEPM